MNEVWKEIDGYVGLYQVSNFGRVKSSWFNKEHILRPQPSKAGYLHVILCKDGKKKILRIHRLVANAFIANDNNLPQVNHKDEDKTNNNLNNLEWCDNRYNTNYGTKVQKVSKKIYSVDECGNIEHFNSAKAASRIAGIVHPNIVRSLTQHMRAGKRRWYYEDM